MYEVVIYPENEEALVQDLIQSVKESGDSRNYIEIYKYLEKLAEFGLDMNVKFKRDSFKYLESDLYELRPRNMRILFTKSNNTFYILNGFFKKSQKTPNREIEIARKHIKDIHHK